MYELLVRSRRAVMWSPALFAGFVAVMLASGPVQAHKVNMFAFAEDDRVFVEGYFTDGKRARNSTVEVFSPSGEVLVAGQTDDQGSFSFEIPQRTDLRIELNSGMGHQTEYTLTEAELTGAPAPAVEDTAGGGPEQVAVVGDDAEPAPGGSSAAVDQAAVRRAVGEALRPVMRSLSELKERRTFSDIIGGIGFIVGIMGVFFYLKARKQSGGSSSG